MVQLKYYSKIENLEKKLTLNSELQPFDLERMRSHGLVARIVAGVLDNPLPVLNALRRIKPILTIGGLTVLTRADDVEEVLSTPDIFEMPFGPEMRSLTGGSDFVLGMPLNDNYYFQLECIKKAFPREEMRKRVTEITSAYISEVMPFVRPGFNPVEILLKRGPSRVCRDYYGLMISDEDRFAEWSLAISGLLFADMGGTAGARDLGLSGAKRINEITLRSIERIEAGGGNSETPLARLVEIHHSTKGKSKHLTKTDIVAIILGMISGFAPTSLLASGNILNVILSMPEARRAVDKAISEQDDDALEKALFESLRFKPIRIGPHRYVNQDYKIARGTRREKVIRKGSTVFASTFSAMFDPNRASAKGESDPNRFNPERPASDSLVFGHDIHWCIGAPLARAHAVQLFKALFSLPGLKPVPGRAGKMTRIGPYPEHLAMTFDQTAEYGPAGQSMVTIALPLKKNADIDAAKSALSDLGNPPQPVLQSVLDETGCIHFCSVTLSDTSAAAQAAEDPVFLVCEISGDGSEAEVLKAFTSAMQDQLAPIVKSYTQAGTMSFPAALRSGLLKVTPFSAKSHGLCFMGAPGHSVARIKAEAALEREARAAVEAAVAANPVDAFDVLSQVRKSVRDTFPWASLPVENTLSTGPGSNAALIRAGLTQPWLLWPLLTLFVAGTVVSTVFLTGPLSQWFVVQLTAAMLISLLGMFLTIGGAAFAIWCHIRHLEETDINDDRWPDAARFDEATANEDHYSQNNLTAVSRIRGTWFRRLILRFVFEVIRLAAVYKFAPGTLSDINTIHFARWVRLPGTQQLMFFSNFGGSWESYLEDFITKARVGLTGVWSNTDGFPKAENIFFKGAEDAERFKRWARRQQIQTRFWYCAYPGIHTRDIRANAAIRQGLASAKTLSEAEEWLSHFGSLARPVDALEKSEPQGMLFGPMGKLFEGELLAVKFPDLMPVKARAAVLDMLLKKVHFGDTLPQGQAVQAAFSYRGLVALGLSDSAADDHGHGFSPAFRQGMDHPHRARINGDVPQNWSWGAEDARTDMVLTAYAANKKDLRAALTPIVRLLKAQDCEIIHRQALRAERVEPFGFLDGVSQPLIQGTVSAARRDDPDNTVAAGEFIFGYPDDRGNLAPSPAVMRNSDLSAALPRIRDPLYPHLSDFGRNGTYMVVRQLQQHVEAFNAYAAANARDDADAEWLKAKMVGRWKNGASLVRAPHVAPDESKDSFRPDNDFRFGATDPQGLSCPLGSHVRRTNPRDSLGEDRDLAMKLANRHRILRRGRGYTNSEEDRGLMFICLNTDIERQFEFVQQSWVNAPGFHALSDETDPLIGVQCPHRQFVIPTPEGGRVLRNLPDFVTMKGGGYFFLPAKRALRYLRALA